MPGFGSPVVKGNAADVADVLEDWYRGQACDGFMLSNPIMPVALRNIVDLVVPELQRRGLFRTEYAGATLRDHMGLSQAGQPAFHPDAAGCGLTVTAGGQMSGGETECRRTGPRQRRRRRRTAG